MFPKTKIIHNSFCLKIVKIISWTISQFSMPVIVLCKNKVVSSWKKFRMHLTIIRNAVIVIIRVFNIGNSCDVPSVGYNLNFMVTNHRCHHPGLSSHQCHPHPSLGLGSRPQRRPGEARQRGGEDMRVTASWFEGNEPTDLWPLIWGMGSPGQ